jgi:hypothetical protein
MATTLMPIPTGMEMVVAGKETEMAGVRVRGVERVERVEVGLEVVKVETGTVVLVKAMVRAREVGMGEGPGVAAGERVEACKR